jgi:glycosyltransferase involved in cell wall biosynthesis
MRILVVTPDLNVQIRPYVDYYAACGHEVHVASMIRRPPGRCTFHYIGLGNVLAPKVVYLVRVGKLRRLIRRFTPDVVHAHWITSSGFQAALAGAHPLVVSIRDLLFHRYSHPVYGRIIRYVLGRTSLLNPVSEQLGDIAVNSLGYPREQVYVGTMGVDTAAFTPSAAPPPASPVRIIATKRFRPDCGQDTVIRALALLRQRFDDFVCEFPGAMGTVVQENERLARELGLADHCRFRYGYDVDDLPDMLRSSHIYVTGSRVDGTSVSLLEAMACGLCPVVTDIVANLPWVDHERSGLLYPKDDFRALADQLYRACKDAAFRQSAGQHARQAAVERADRVKNLQRLEARLRRLVDESRERNV